MSGVYYCASSSALCIPWAFLTTTFVLSAISCGAVVHSAPLFIFTAWVCMTCGGLSPSPTSRVHTNSTCLPLCLSLLLVHSLGSWGCSMEAGQRGYRRAWLCGQGGSCLLLLLFSSILLSYISGCGFPAFFSPGCTAMLSLGGAVIPAAERPWWEPALP